MVEIPQPNAESPSSTDQPLPPFVQIVKTPNGVNVATNLPDAWLAVALLELGKARLLKETEPTVVKPNGFRFPVPGRS